MRVLLTLAIALALHFDSSAQTGGHAAQLAAVETMLRRGQYERAARQAEGLVTLGRQLQDPDLEASALLLWGRSLTDDPGAGTASRVKGIRRLREAASVYRAAGNETLVDSITTILAQMGDSATVANRTERAPAIMSRNRNRRLPTVDSIDEIALNAIVSQQEREILALTDSQLRQLVLIEQKDRLLDDYAFQVLEDSVSLIRQEKELAEQRMLVKAQVQNRNFLLLLAGAVSALLALLYLRFRSSRRHEAELEEQNQLLEIERQRSEDLLLNILPAPIATELKANGRALPRTYDTATVMFLDFVGFSLLASRMDSAELIGHLDEAFRGIDRIVQQYGVEKIKTIGDAYMCAAGLPVPCSDHAERCVEAALAIQDYLTGNIHFKARIGIHSGPVVAGVVGSHKFGYDVWGDTVNQAARLEAASATGEVSISAVTRELLPDDFVTRSAGSFPAKNMGDLERFVVTLR